MGPICLLDLVGHCVPLHCPRHKPWTPEGFRLLRIHTNVIFFRSFFYLFFCLQFVTHLSFCLLLTPPPCTPWTLLIVFTDWMTIAFLSNHTL